MGYLNMREQKLLHTAEKIYQAALAEVDPEHLVKQNVSIQNKNLIICGRSFDLRVIEHIYVAAIGKAAAYMARGIEGVLGERIQEGLFLTLPGTGIRLKKFVSLPASHPLPDERSLNAALGILRLASKVGTNDLLIVLISGGGSAQLCFPVPGVSLEEKRLVTGRLLKAGADIQELNTVRKHLSLIKGGHLARAAFPGTVASIVLSDVRHNDLATIASGPTYWDSTTYEDAFEVLQKYSLWDSLPEAVRIAIEEGMEGQSPETLKEDDPVFRKVFHFILGDNRFALQAAQKKAANLGFRAILLSTVDQGEAREAARVYVALLASLFSRKGKHAWPLCLLAGGELTVTVKGRGKGGRNQEFVLASLIEAEKQKIEDENWMILSMGSDGIDGPTDAAGAWISPLSLEKARRFGLRPEEFLENNDSYNFFKQISSLLLTGPTHTNVMDFRIFLVE